MSTLATNAITDASGGNTTTINGYTPTVSNMAGRNRIINGDMRISQRNAGAAVTINSTGTIYTVDRFFAYGQSSDGVYTVEQVTDAPANFTNSTKITVTTADTSIGASQLYFFGQVLEGFNVADFGWGTANAQTVTVSFWVRSSLTETFSGVLKNDSTSSYPFTYTISTADTWEYKTITIPGVTSGTWAKDNSAGMRLNWSLGIGSTYTTTGNAWASGNYFKATGATDVIGTSGATLYITGVQLEAGSVATPFEHRQYGTELHLCKRYFEIWKYESGVGIDRYRAGSGWTDSIVFNMEVQKRAAPTVAIGGSAEIRDGSNAAKTISFADSNSGVIRLGVPAAQAPLTYSVGTIRFASGVGDFVSMSAEL